MGIYTRRSPSPGPSCGSAPMCSLFLLVRSAVSSATCSPESEFPYVLFDLQPLHRRRVWRNAKTLTGAMSAWHGLARLAREERPAIVVGTGGYAAAATMAYAVWRRIPLVQQAGDSFPGLTARFFSRWSREMYLTFPEAGEYLTSYAPGALVDTGAPIEPPPDPRPDRAVARQHWGFPATGGNVLLIYGGSQGSRSLNITVAEWVRRGLPPDLYLIWMTGAGSFNEFSSLAGDRVQIRAYLSPIAQAYAAADVAVARAGAMTTSELLAWGIPAVLVPLPTAAADHQTTNALALERAGVAIHLPQALLSGAQLDLVVGNLLRDRSRLVDMRACALDRARPHAAETIAQRILAVMDRSLCRR